MKPSLILVLISGFAVSCEPKSKIVSPNFELQGQSAVSGEELSAGKRPSVIISGSLVIGGASAASSGVSANDSDRYSLSCVTFEESPLEFAVPIIRDGINHKFSQSLEDAAGRPLGCFLRKNEQTESTVVFPGGTGIVVGAGNLVLTLNYDPVTKLSKANIDAVLSTALLPEVVESAKTNRQVTSTDVGDLSGTYNVSCEADVAKGWSCGKFGAAMPNSVHISQFKALEKNKIAIWTSKAKHDVCVPESASDASPRFGFGLSGAAGDFLTYDYRSNSNLTVAMDSVWSALKEKPLGSAGEQIKVAVLNRVNQTDGWRVGQCKDIDTRFSENNCRLVPTTFTTYEYWNPETTVRSPQKSPMWYNKFCSAGENSLEHYCAPQDYKGKVKSKLTACSNFWTPDQPICPAGTTVDDVGSGTFMAYYAAGGDEEIPLRLVCSDPTGSYVSYQDLAQGSNKSAAMSQAKEAFGCDQVKGGAFDGKHELQRRAIIKELVELSMFPVYHDSSKICRNRKLPKDFTFASCSENTSVPDWTSLWDQNSSQDQTAELFCYEMRTLMKSLNMKVNRTTGMLIEDTHATDDIVEAQAREFCPDELGVYESSQRSPEDSARFNRNCKSAILQLSMDAQLSAAMRTFIGTWNLIPYVACGDTTGAMLESLQAGFEKACLPQARLATMCDSTGTCTDKLHCEGSANGRCYSDGAFLGRIEGRLGVMDLKASVNNAFEASSSVIDKFSSVIHTQGATGTAGGSSDKNGTIGVCSVVNSTILNGTKEGQGFSGYYTNRRKKTCEPLYDKRNEIADGPTQIQQPKESYPELDAIMKLKFMRQ